MKTILMSFVLLASNGAFARNDCTKGTIAGRAYRIATTYDKHAQKWTSRLSIQGAATLNGAQRAGRTSDDMMSSLEVWTYAAADSNLKARLEILSDLDFNSQNSIYTLCVGTGAAKTCTTCTSNYSTVR